ncbi:MAG: DUF3459 domain-containing protein [Chloroflexi bacterium]|nr:DUF3459 domain-containing protein [Chloroflexota bacterium]
MTSKQEKNTALMQDFVFGALDADDSIAASERRRWCGLRHNHNISPLRPQPNQPVRITVSLGPGTLVDHITAYVTYDGSEPRGHRGRAEHGIAISCQPTATTWQPLQWDYGEIWQGEIPGQAPGTHVRYRIQGWRQHEPDFSIWSQEANLDGTREKPGLYGYSIDAYSTPAWAHEAVVYEIFVDRFAPVPSTYLRPARLSQFCGGNLSGIREHLDYLSDLGVDAIWLTPIFETRTYHGYDVVDYHEVTRHFGSKDDLRELIEAAHARSLHILLDFVASHTSDQFAPFQQALHDPDSPYRHWYSFSDAYKHGYRCFFDVPTMPQLNLDHPHARTYILEAAQYWLREFQIDGYRLDYAAGPSHDFWTAFRLACKQVNPDCWLVGEVTQGSADLRTYAGRLDGCLDFNFTRQMRRLFSSDDPGRIQDFATSIIRSQRYFPADFTRPTFLENHDMNRILSILHGDKQRLRLAAGLMMALGSTPILYYGTEVGLSQPRPKAPHREESRHPMRWGDRQDTDLLATFKQLVHWRRRHPATVYGDLTTLRLEAAAGVWVVQRQFEHDTVLVLVNVGARPQPATLPPGAWLHSDGARAETETTIPAVSILLLELEAVG